MTRTMLDIQKLDSDSYLYFWDDPLVEELNELPKSIVIHEKGRSSAL
jgi:hypothetical protein